MVQDVLDIEYYPTQVHGRFMKYRDHDISESDEDLLDTIESSIDYGERQPIILVPIPFTSPWFQDTLYKRNTIELQVDTNPPKRSKIMTNPIWPAGIMDSDASQSAVLAKVYLEDDSNQPRNVRLNDIVEIVGVLSELPTMHDYEGEHNRSKVNYLSPFDTDMETFIHLSYESSTSVVELQNAYDQLPHIHVLHWKTIDMDSLVYPCLAGSSDFTTRLCNLEDDRFLSIQTFSSHIFNGDANASEALLLSLMSMAERDKGHRPIHLPSGATLGCASLKLVAPTQEACSLIRTRLMHVLKTIMPVVATLELTEKSLESPAEHNLCIPEKRGRLRPSSMQLPKGSCMVIDESKLDTKTRSKGYNTVAALSRIVRHHSISYNFHGIEFDFETDFIVIVISKAGGDMDDDDMAFPSCSLNCRLTHVGDVSPSLQMAPEEHISSRIRSYIRSCRKRYPTSLSDQELLNKAQNDFIERRNMRTEIKPIVDEEDFHRWLTMTRLFARSSRKSAATLTDWEASLRLDGAMKSI